MVLQGAAKKSYRAHLDEPPLVFPIYPYMIQCNKPKHSGRFAEFTESLDDHKLALSPKIDFEPVCRDGLDGRMGKERG
jgi:hypothetical protein